jgi:exodeoxyribonuclease V beta subunit
VRLADFPAGAGPGILVHAIFEKLDFTQADGPALLERVGAALAAHGLPQTNLELLAAAVRDVLGTPLDPGVDASRLALLAPEQRIDEMPFMLPVANSLTPERLAAVFERHATDPTTRRYAERAASLAFPALAGHLRGFIDLVFRRGERWYVVDYKSNHLGPVASDYARPALERAMLEHDYVLQYHLYLVALHRHLRLRLPGYDCDRHLGGTYYLFVRGMCERHAPGCGVLHDRPPRELIEALSGLLGDER